ncbi:hypothetical protein D3C87_278820 [compost metagenome]
MGLGNFLKNANDPNKGVIPVEEPAPIVVQVDPSVRKPLVTTEFKAEFTEAHIKEMVEDYFKKKGIPHTPSHFSFMDYFSRTQYKDMPVMVVSCVKEMKEY